MEDTGLVHDKLMDGCTIPSANIAQAWIALLAMYAGLSQKADHALSITPLSLLDIFTLSIYFNYI